MCLVAAALLLTGCGDDDDEAETESGSEAAAESASEDEPTGDTLAEGEQLSANDATEEELQAIPGVGPEIAEEIVEYRPYDAETGPDKFREEMSKYISDDEIEGIIVYLDFES